MGFLTVIGDAIWKRLEPLLTERLNELQATAQDQLNEWRTEAVTMISEALPEIAGKIAEQTVLTVFEKTQVDEAADAVSDAITDIVNRLPRFPFLR